MNRVEDNAPPAPSFRKGTLGFRVAFLSLIDCFEKVANDWALRTEEQERSVASAIAVGSDQKGSQRTVDSGRKRSEKTV